MSVEISIVIPLRFSEDCGVKKLLLILLAVPLAGILILAGGYVFWSKIEAGALREVQTRIKAGGLPTGEADFFSHIPTADRNAAPLLQKAAGLVKSLPDGNALKRCFPGSAVEKNDDAPDSGIRLEEVRTFFRDPVAGEVIQLLMEAATKDDCSFGRDYSKGIFLELPEISPMMKAVRLLLNHSWVLAADGRVEEAANEIRAALKISNFYRQDPILISWLIGAACEQMSLSAMMSLCGAAEALSPRSLDLLETAVKESRSKVRLSLVRAFDGERVFFGGSLFEALLSRKAGQAEMQAVTGLGNLAGQENWGGMTAIIWLYQIPLRPLLVADQAAYLRFMFAARSQVLDPNDSGRDPEKLLEQIPRSAILTRLSVPALEPVIRKGQEIESLLDLALIGLRAEKYRLANGIYPKSLAEIPWEGRLPQDPFAGGDFRYKEESEGSLLIYSVGPDLMDNQGIPRNAKGDKDIVWTVRHPSPVGNNP